MRSSVFLLGPREDRSCNNQNCETNGQFQIRADLHRNGKTFGKRLDLADRWDLNVSHPNGKHDGQQGPSCQDFKV